MNVNLLQERLLVGNVSTLDYEFISFGDTSLIKLEINEEGSKSCRSQHSLLVIREDGEFTAALRIPPCLSLRGGL